MCILRFENHILYTLGCIISGELCTISHLNQDSSSWFKSLSHPDMTWAVQSSDGICPKLSALASRTNNFGSCFAAHCGVFQRCQLEYWLEYQGLTHCRQRNSWGCKNRSGDVNKKFTGNSAIKICKFVSQCKHKQQNRLSHQLITSRCSYDLRLPQR